MGTRQTAALHNKDVVQTCNTAIQTMDVHLRRGIAAHVLDAVMVVLRENPSQLRPKNRVALEASPAAEPH